MRSIDEYNVELMISLAIVMGGYSLAQWLHVSGPVAMAVAGLLIGNAGVALAMSDTTRDHVLKFWALIDELLNAILFLLIGLEVIAISPDPRLLLAGLAAIPLVLAARALSVGAPLLGDAAVRLARRPCDADPGLGRTARRHLDRARSVPARRAGPHDHPRRDLYHRALFGDRPGRHDRSARQPAGAAGVT